MSLRYKIIKPYYRIGIAYETSSYNIAFYRYWECALPDNIHYKVNSFGLRFWKAFRKVANSQTGIKIYY